MKKLFSLFVCAAALIATAAEEIVPPAGKTVKMPLGEKMTSQAGGFAVDFTLNFNDPAKDYVGYIASCRNWKKPFCGFAFGVNRIKGKTAVWFYPLDENGKVFGPYTYYQLENGKRYHAEVSYQNRRCTLTIDGKNIASVRLRQDISLFDTIEIGGLGGKNYGIDVHSFKFLDIKKK